MWIGLMSFLATLIGTALLCLAMRKHSRIVFRVVPSPRTQLVLRACAIGCLLVAVLLATSVLGTIVGITAFFGAFTVTMLSTAFLMTLLETRQP